MSSAEMIKDIIEKISIIPFEEINTDDSLISIGIDSLKSVELIIELEDGLNIKFDDGDLDPSKLNSVQNIIDLVKKYSE